MKIFKIFRILGIFYRRNAAKNFLMVIFMFVTNIILSTFVIFFNAGQNVLDVLEGSYFEYLSADVSLYQSLPTNNELINVKTYKRPTLEYINAIMEKTGRFNVRPDYTYFFENSELSLFDKNLLKPHIISYDGEHYGFGINEVYLQKIKEEVSDNNSPLLLNFKLEMNITMYDKILPININEEVPISFIYEEPTYFSTPKLYVPQSFLDKILGRIYVREGETLNNYLLNVNPEHELANFRLRCHFDNPEQRTFFMRIATDLSDLNSGLEVTSDPQSKVQSFTALYDYLNILIIILLVFVIVGSAVIYTVIAHTSLLSNLRQMALISVLGAKKADLFTFYLVIIFFNFGLGLTSYIFLPYATPFLNYFFFNYMKVNVAFTINYRVLLMIVSGNFLFLLTLVSFIFIVNIRRPLVNLLVDA